MSTKPQIELFLENESGTQQVAYPFVESDHVSLSNGMDIDTMIRQDVSMPTVAHEDLSFKVGVGDQDVSSAIVDSSVAEMTIKGKTYQNILPEPSTHVLTNNKEMFKVNEGLDPNAEIVDGVSKSAILKGNTLVNLLTKTNISVSANTSVSENLKIAYTLPPKKYIMFYNVVVPNTSPNASNNRHTPRVNLEDGSSLYQGYDGFNTSTGRKYWIFTASSNIVDVYYWVQNISTDVVVNNCMLLEYQEGMENWDIPLFRGMQSVEVPVLTTTGSNMVNPTDIEVIGCKSYDVDSDGITNIVGDTTGYWARSYIRYAHHLKANTTYYIYCDGDSTGTINAEEWVDNINTGRISWNNFYKYTPETDVLYEVRIFLNTDASPFTCSKIRIGFFETTTKPSSYEPYKSNILMVNEDVTLRGIGNVKDTLDCLTGELTERIGEYTIDGNENWEIHGYFNVDGYKSFVTTITGLNNFYSGSTIIISGDFKSGSWNDYTGKKAEEMVWNHDPNKIGIKVKNETASNVEELKAYLASNPITFQYELATESIKTVDLSSSGNWEKVVLDGSEDESWGDGDNGLSKTHRFYVTIPNLLSGNHSPIIDSTYFTPIQTGTSSQDTPCVQIASNKIHFRIERQIADSLTSFKTWLQQNPLTVWYPTTTHQDSTQVKQPIFFKDGHIQLSSGADNSLIPTLDYQAKTSNSYVMDLMKPSTVYTMKAKSVSGTFTLDGTSFILSTNSVITTPSTLTSKFLVVKGSMQEMMFLEGNVYSKAIPYFKGIKSAFEDESKIEVLSTGKNLFDGVSYINGFVNSVNNYVVARDNDVTSILIDVEKNTDYILSTKTYFNRNEIGGSLTPISIGSVTNMITCTRIGNTISFNSGNYTHIIIYLNSTKINMTDVQIEQGTVATTYEPYKSNSTKIPLLSPLRSLPNGVEDEVVVDRMKNKVTLIQRVGKVVFDGSEEWYCNWSNDGNCHNGHTNIYDAKKVVGTSFICNKFRESTTTANNPNYESAFMTGRDNWFGIAIHKDKLDTYDAKGMKKWLSQNPLVVYYELETPVITEVDLEGFPYVYKDGHIFLNGEIIPVTEIKYSINQSHMIEASNQDIIRHQKEIDYLYRLIGEYVRVDYKNTLLSLNLELK